MYNCRIKTTAGMIALDPNRVFQCISIAAVIRSATSSFQCLLLSRSRRQLADVFPDRPGNIIDDHAAPSVSAHISIIHVPGGRWGRDMLLKAAIS